MSQSDITLLHAPDAELKCSRLMDKWLALVAYWLTLILLAITFVFIVAYIVVRGVCTYKKVTESTTHTKEEFELLGEAEIVKPSTTPVHSSVD